MNGRTVATALLVVVSACASAERSSPPDTFRADCTREIKDTLLHPEAATVRFVAPSRARVTAVDPSDGTEARLDFICAEDAQGGVVATLLAD